MNKKGSRYQWLLPSCDGAVIASLSRRYNLSFPVMQTLVNRGYCEPESIEDFLFTVADEAIGDPRMLADAKKAVSRIVYATRQQEKILIVGDYDVDGITSTSLLLLCLLEIEANVNFFLPHRMRDGYGLSEAIVDRAIRSKYDVIITVDNGISAIDAVKKAQSAGIDVIVTDHHQPQALLPPAYAIVNPQRADCAYPHKELAGVGVIFKVISLLFEELNKPLPAKVYELLTLGTVADVVPLKKENRYWVRRGLRHIHETQSYALQVLKDNVQYAKPVLTAMDIGFSITPQLNALGRLDDPRDGVAFLIANDRSRVARIGDILRELNISRREIERTIIDHVERIIASDAVDLTSDKIIILAHEHWQPGVIGLAAGRIAATYQRPVILLRIGSDGIARGSCRSIETINIFKVLQSVEDILESFGGHAQAAGLSVRVDALDALKQRLHVYFQEHFTEEDFIARITLDATVSLPDLTKQFVHDLGYLEPFGAGNNRPLFYISEVTLVKPPTLIKDAHVKCFIFAEGIVKPVIFFNRPDIYEALRELGDAPFDIAAYVTENHWNGQVKIELQGLDISLSS